jgi:tripartite-type tricarboxylate transporter receptor subunit TctC
MKGIVKPSALRAMLIALACSSGIAYAQQKPVQRQGDFPARPIRFLVGNAPGGGIDITARAVAQKLTERLGQQVVVDNRPGASGVIAMDLTARATPDGYTMLVTSGSLIASAMARKHVKFDVRNAYAPVTQLTSLYYLLLVNASFPVKSVKDLLALGKSKPGSLNYGSSGVGGAGHLAGALFSHLSGVPMTHIPYKGGGLVLADLISGQIQLGFTSTISSMPHIRSGRLKALAVTNDHRAKAFPDLPTIAEAGVPGFELINWYGLFAPAGTAPAVVKTVHSYVTQDLSSAEVQAMFAKDGAEAVPSASPEAFAGLLAGEVERWQKFVKMPGFAEGLK